MRSLKKKLFGIAALALALGIGDTLGALSVNSQALPSEVSEEATESVVRFDGIYYSDQIPIDEENRPSQQPGENTYRFYFRFYEDGSVAASSVVQEPDQVIGLLDLSSAYMTGQYIISGSAISFLTISEIGQVLYIGRMEGDVLRLNSLSFINDSRATRDFFFLEEDWSGE